MCNVKPHKNESIKMNLNSETILDIYTYNNKKVFCVLNVHSEGGKLQKNSLRVLSEDDWINFDKELKNLIATTDDWNNEKCLKFNLKADVQVAVLKSSISLKNFYKCFGKIYNCESDFDGDPVDIVLECQFHFRQEVPLSFSKEHESHTDALDSISCSPLSHVTNTPTIKKYKTDKVVTVKTLGTRFVEYDENISTDDDTCKSAAEIERTIESEINVDRKTSKKLNRTKSLEESSPEEPIQEKAFQTDHLRIPKKRSKSDNVLLELNNVNIYEKNLHQKEELRASENHGQYAMKAKKKRSKTLDEVSELYPSNVEKLSSKSKMEDCIEKPSKNLEKSCKEASSHRREREETKICSLKENNEISEKPAKSPLIEDEAVIETFANDSSSSPETPKYNSLTDSATDTSPQKLLRLEGKHKSSIKEGVKVLRRSGRSPSKPKRFLDEQPELLAKTKAKRHKNSHKNKELFGTDDDEDNFFENANKNNYSSNKIKVSIFETPASKKSEPCTSSSSKSSKKKLQSDKNSECQQEKRHMSKWLSKKKSSEQEQTKSLKTNSRSLSSAYKALPLKSSVKLKSRTRNGDLEDTAQTPGASPITLELPSKEELELIRNKTKLMQKENARVKAELDKMRSSPPREVEILSLKNISVNDILDTFSTYKSDLDEIYENNHKRDYIKGHDGINHCFVIRLLEQNIQMKMLDKLTQVYNNSKSTTQATLFANALLPEWVIRVYMEKFNFTRQQAIDQVKAQEEFQLHMEEQNDNTFMFD